MRALAAVACFAVALVFAGHATASFDVLALVLGGVGTAIALTGQKEVRS